MKPVIDLIGKKFGRLTVLQLSEKRKTKHGTAIYWECLCVCGNKIITSGSSLKSGGTKSCWCLHREILIKRNTSHGKSGLSEYKIWQLIKERTLNKNNPGYENYGGRGIRLCKRWMKFENFFKDMGPRPSKNHSIDRINNDGDYKPSNCRWADSLQQANNTRLNRNITFNSKTMTLSEWSRHTGILIQTICNRLNRQNWSIERALTEKAWKGKNGTNKRI